ncbi:thermonuclease family protein [Dyadobacter chenhuakuii]|uniref:Thermonuclease family protein n=1 Tax=Dyadobacter chenhuakuii TaxID=2909339 RepID=A0ABY4XJH0_9BACT|nr:thermonuclease family protein [Dyadobacter chenhuakuii]MCF2496326.1 thermonuclease family protein [Dyadobacter chenhuakuii]USJ30386.1 thermonuclease family protein [Dyadobacter chenhuakuii]
MSRVRFNVLIALTCLLTLSSFSDNNAIRLQNGSIQQHYDLPNPLKAEVIAIQDGDTIELKFLYAGKKAGQRMGKPIRIRLLHVNCPERGRPYYKVAKQYTSQQCFRKTVQIRHAGNFDKYGRLLGEVVLPNGRILNKELVKAGLAVHFKKYSKSQEYANLEIQAKKQKVGIWSQSSLFLGQL